MPGDLHTHSTFSDGGLAIEKLPRMAAWAGMTHLAVTDHDSFLAYDYALQHPTQQGVQLIPAMEISAWDAQRKRKVHLLCYGPDRTAELQQNFEKMAAARNHQQRVSLNALLQLYPFLDQEEILQKAQSSVSLFKAHLMRTLREYGLTDEIYGDLYRRLLTRGGPCYAPTEYRLPIQDALEMAKRARAVVILAHPGVYDTLELAAELAKEGCIDGVEVHHPGNTPAVQVALKNLAMQHRLIVTGGTDYHGMNEDRVCPLGSCFTGDVHLNRLISLLERRKKT